MCSLELSNVKEFGSLKELKICNKEDHQRTSILISFLLDYLMIGLDDEFQMGL